MPRDQVKWKHLISTILIQKFGTIEKHPKVSMKKLKRSNSKKAKKQKKNFFSFFFEKISAQYISHPKSWKIHLSHSLVFFSRVNHEIKDKFFISLKTEKNLMKSSRKILKVSKEKKSNFFFWLTSLIFRKLSFFVFL